MSKLGRPLVMSADKRRKEIFFVAEQLFCEKGFENVTMSEIATALSMSKKTLYVHFQDKKELLKELVSSSYIVDELQTKQHENNVEALKQLLKISTRHVLSDRHIQLCRLAIAESQNIDGLSQTFYELGIAKSRDQLISAIQQIDSKLHKINVSAEMMADIVFGASITKHFIDRLMLKTTVDLEEIYKKIEHSIDVLFVSSAHNMEE